MGLQELLDKLKFTPFETVIYGIFKKEHLSKFETLCFVGRYSYICPNTDGKLVVVTDRKDSYQKCIKSFRQTKPNLSGTGEGSDRGNH